MSEKTSVIVHPLVLLSVVDHYNRACKGTSARALGVLLGHPGAHGAIHIANSFAGMYAVCYGVVWCGVVGHDVVSCTARPIIPYQRRLQLFMVSFGSSM